MLVFRLYKENIIIFNEREMSVCVCPYVSVTEVSSPEGMADNFPLEFVYVQVCMGVCRVMASDYLYAPLFGLQLCVFGHSLTMTQRLKQPWNISHRS